MRPKLARLLRWWGMRPWALRWGLVVLQMGLLWWASSRTRRGGSATVFGSLLHNGAHVAAYGALGALALLAIGGAAPPRRRAMLGAALLAAAYGAVDELHQAHVPGRVASWSDLGSDLFGAAAAVLCCAWAIEPTARKIAWAGLSLGCGLGCVALATFTDW